MKRLLVVTLVALTGCGGLVDEADDFRNASPSRQGIDIKVPSSGQALESSEVGQTQQALQGDRANTYTITRGATVVVNTGTAAWLKICEAIVSYPPTTLGETEAVWGPWTDALSPNTYKFTVTKVATGYDYVLQGKDKTRDDSAYLKLISGHHEPGAAAHQGNGTFKMDWDAAQQLPEHAADTIGTAEFAYSRNDQLDVTVDVQFRQVNDNDHPGQRVDADYAFEQANGGDGAFEFKVTNAQSQRWTIKSRWHRDGSGRADVNAYNSPSDTTPMGTINECWGATFLSTYYKESWAGGQTWGEEPSCAFATAEYSTL
ncbi:MAG: hypothetical protein HY901_32625 [Deltaproteobacteria bacterium]|nr:hypothetical protein [Deltaproteobacteria bacterium]